MRSSCNVFSWLASSCFLLSLTACTQPVPGTPATTASPAGNATSSQPSRIPALTVEAAEPFFTALPVSAQDELKRKYGSCLSSVMPFVGGLDTPAITACQFLMQPTSQLDGSAKPFDPDALRLDRSFLTERALRLSYQAGDQVRQIQTYAELKAIYAPIESPAEALSFVLLKTYGSQLLTQETINNLLTGASAESGPQWLVARTPGTQVRRQADGGFLVQNLLVGGMCAGSSISYQISAGGDVTKTAETPLYRQKVCPVE